MPYNPLQLALIVLRFALRFPHKVYPLWLSIRAIPTLYDRRHLKNFVRAIVIAEYARAVGAVHLHAHWTLAAQIAAAVARSFGYTYSFMMHAYDLYEEDAKLEKLGHGVADRARDASFIATCTGYNREYLQAFYGERLQTPVHTVYHGVDANFFVPGEKASDPPLVLSVGRIIPCKGFDRLIEFLGRAAQQGHDFSCAIIGTGDARLVNALVERVEALGLSEKIRFTGGLPAREVRTYYQQADIFVLAGSLELGHYGLPNVLVEAMSAEAAVLATAMQSTYELIEPDVDGIVVADDDDEALYEALCRLLTDPALRRRLGTNGRQKVLQRFAIDKTTRILYDLFQQATAGRLNSGSG
ncbi:MAG: glycosyltransferase family 4 protein [Anaerolineae bacterium]|nr:glycosyltransferase family 4 protein [Anaerolineae bacterium]